MQVEEWSNDCCRKQDGQLLCCLMRKSFCTVPVSANAARQDSDRDFLIIANHQPDREIITKLKDGLYDIELENDEVVSNIMRSRQEWSSPAYDALPFKEAVEREGIEL
jgi:hypothetical protein